MSRVLGGALGFQLRIVPPATAGVVACHAAALPLAHTRAISCCNCSAAPERSRAQAVCRPCSLKPAQPWSMPVLPACQVLHCALRGVGVLPLTLCDRIAACARGARGCARPCVPARAASRVLWPRSIFASKSHTRVPRLALVKRKKRSRIVRFGRPANPGASWPTNGLPAGRPAATSRTRRGPDRAQTSRTQTDHGIKQATDGTDIRLRSRRAPSRVPPRLAAASRATQHPPIATFRQGPPRLGIPARSHWAP